MWLMVRLAVCHLKPLADISGLRPMHPRQGPNNLSKGWIPGIDFKFRRVMAQGT